MDTTHAPTESTPIPVAPGKMTLALRAARLPPTDAPRVLRVAILEAGRVRSERLVRRREAVTIGGREKNTLVLSGEHAPARHELFALRGDRWFLELGPSMQARVSDGAGVVDVAPAGAVPLGDESRGRVRIGDATVLFQFVVPPPLMPRAQLPAAARANLVRNMDWLFASFVALSLIAHGGFVAYLRDADWPVRERWEYVPQDVLDFVMQPLPAAAPAPVASREPDAVEPGPPAPTSDSGPPARPHPSKRPAPVRGGDGRPEPSLAPDLSRMGVAGILGHLAAEPGSVADVLRGGDPGGDQDDALAQVRGVHAPIGDPSSSLLRTRHPGDGPVVPVGQIDRQVVADQDVRSADRTEQPVRAVVRPGRPPDPIGGTGELPVLDVRRVVNGALGGIQRCYERQLRHDQTLRGRITVRFTVTGAGTVSGARAEEAFDPTVGSCVAGVVARLRFPPPEGGSITFAFPFVFEPGAR